MNGMQIPGLPATLPFWASIAVAASPLTLSMLLRFIIGRNRAMKMFVTASATWLAMNILLSPYLHMMRSSIGQLRDLLGN